MPWVEGIRRILDRPTFGALPWQARDLELMFEARLTPIEAAAAIAIDEFHEVINA